MLFIHTQAGNVTFFPFTQHRDVSLLVTTGDPVQGLIKNDQKNG